MSPPKEYTLPMAMPTTKLAAKLLKHYTKKMRRKTSKLSSK